MKILPFARILLASYFLLLIVSYDTSLEVIASAVTSFGNPTVPSSGGSAGCWIQIIQQPVTHTKVCIHRLILHLNQGTLGTPPDAFEIRVYEVNTTSNIATLKRQRNISVDVTNQDEQEIKLDYCLMAYKGEYVGIANPQGPMRDVVVSGGSPSWKYWNKFEATSNKIGSTFVANNEFGPGSLGWRIDAMSNTDSIFLTTTRALSIDTTSAAQIAKSTTTSFISLTTTTLVTGVVTAINLSQGTLGVTGSTTTPDVATLSVGNKLFYHSSAITYYLCVLTLFVICFIL